MPSMQVHVRRFSVVSSRPFDEIVRRLTANTHPSSSAGVPGINLPMGLKSEGFPLGLGLDAAAGRDRDLLVLARAVEHVIERVPGPAGF